MALCHLELSTAELCWQFCSRKAGLGKLSEHKLRPCISNFTQWPQGNCGIWFKYSHNGFLHTLLVTFGLDTCGYSHWPRKEDERIASSSCRLFLYFLGTGPWEAWEGKWCCFVSQPGAQGHQQHLLLWDPCLSSEAFSEAFSEQRTK